MQFNREQAVAKAQKELDRTNRIREKLKNSFGVEDRQFQSEDERVKLLEERLAKLRSGWIPETKPKSPPPPPILGRRRLRAAPSFRISPSKRLKFNHMRDLPKAAARLESFIDALEQLIAEYLFALKREQGRPTGREIREWFQEVGGVAQRWNKLLETSDETKANWLRQTIGCEYWRDDSDGELKRTNAERVLFRPAIDRTLQLHLAQVRYIQRAAEHILKRRIGLTETGESYLWKKGIPPPHPADYRLGRELKGLFERFKIRFATGITSTFVKILSFALDSETNPDDEGRDAGRWIARQLDTRPEHKRGKRQRSYKQAKQRRK